MYTPDTPERSARQAAHMPDFSQLLAFEDGALDLDATIVLFSDLISSGLAYRLQGYYGRVARDLINAGYLDPSGAILIHD